MNAYVERVNGAVRTEYLDRFYEENGISKINEILYDYLIKYSSYRPHRSLNLLNPIKYYNKSNYKDSSMEQIYLTQTGGLICPLFVLQLKESDTCINK